MDAHDSLGVGALRSVFAAFGLQIFIAHPALYIGQESGFEYDKAGSRIGAINTPEAERLQRAAHGVDQILVAPDHGLAMAQQKSDPLAVVGLRFKHFTVCRMTMLNSRYRIVFPSYAS